MADQETGAAKAGNGGHEEAAVPSLGVLTQYVKDLSFENPHAPRSLTQQNSNPKIEINVNVNAKPLGTDMFEVDLAIEAKAKAKAGETDDTETVVFAVELNYGGIFKIQNVPEENLHPLVMIECPRILFPFARQIIAEATRNGGFPPLLIDPIDFSVLYRQKLEQAKATQDAETSPVQGTA